MAFAMPTSIHAAGEHLKGKWTTPDPNTWDSFDGTGKLLNGGSTHMALLRGKGDSTWIVHWHDFTDYQLTGARLTLIRPMTDTIVSCAVPEVERLFCSGHTTTRDGRLLVVGGTEVE